MKKVSVILLSYNRPVFIQEAIRSVLSQSYQNFELIIIDDNSCDDVKRLLRYFAGLDSRIKLFFTNVKDSERHLTQRGQENINLALKSGMVTGDFISYMADDDFYLPNRFRIFVTYFNRFPEISCLYSNQLMIDEVKKEASLRGTVGVTRGICCKIDMGSVMHRTNIFEKVGYWEDFAPEINYGVDKFAVVDALFFDKIGKAGYYFYPIDLPLDVHRYHGKSYTQCIIDGNKDFKGLRE